MQSILSLDAYKCGFIKHVLNVTIFVMVLMQIQSVTEEKKRLKADLEEAYKRHKEELEIQQLQHFQVNGRESEGGWSV